MKAPVLALCLLALAAFAAAAEDLVPLRRYALVAGSNDGGAGRVRLKYAESDARAFASVIQELGGVRTEDLVLVVNASLPRLRAGLERVQELVSAPRAGEERRELLIYYSGHSDDEGLILGAERFSWEDLRARITDIPADVKVAILDSCSSGSLTRTKGGVARPAFLFDASADMKGHAYLTSSSAEEAAQESDRIGASFFTHFLISGLRGAADTVGDGVVTLNEAYAFAFQETLASTEKTQYGPQHPAYDINLTGSGDLVLTDLRAASAKLRIADDVSGRMYFRDSRGVLAVELDKQAGQSIELGLTPGTYNVVLDGKSGRLGAQLRISARQSATLSRSSLKPVATDRTTARGASLASVRPDPNETSGPSRRQDQKPKDSSDPVSAAAAVGAAIGTAVATAISTTVKAVTGGGSAEPSPDQVPGQTVSDSPVDEPPVDAQAEPTVSSGADAAAPDASAAPAAAAGSATVSTARPVGEEGVQKFHFSVIPEISSNMFASRDSHVVAINLLVGSSYSSKAFELGGLANFEAGGMTGCQIGGLGNVVMGDTMGVQIGGLMNLVGGQMHVVQVAGLANGTQGPMDGVQIGGLANVALADARGVQVAGLFNWSRGDMTGAQVSGGVNLATRVSGPQISVVNISDTVSGAQVGVVNIAGHVDGVQVGLVNISREINGVPIGLVSIVENGRLEMDVWYDTDAAVNASFSFGSRSFYTVLSAGWVPDSVPSRWSLGVGLGARLPMGRLWADFDATALWDELSYTSGSPSGYWDVHPRLRAALGIPIFGGLALEAGVTVKLGVPNDWASPLQYDPALFIGMQL